MIKRVVAIIILTIVLATLLPYVKKSETPLTPDRNGQIPWAEAVNLIETCSVGMITQLHSLRVDLDLKDGSRVTTVEPAIDEVFRVYDKTRSVCGSIPIATE